MTCLICFTFICVFVIVLVLVKVVRARYKYEETLMEEIPHTCDFLVEWAWVVEYYKLDLLHSIYFHIGKVHTYYIGIHVSPMKKRFIIGCKVVVLVCSTPPPHLQHIYVICLGVGIIPPGYAYLVASEIFSTIIKSPSLLSHISYEICCTTTYKPQYTIIIMQISTCFPPLT